MTVREVGPAGTLGLSSLFKLPLEPLRKKLTLALLADSWAFRYSVIWRDKGRKGGHKGGICSRAAGMTLETARVWSASLPCSADRQLPQSKIPGA